MPPPHAIDVHVGSRLRLRRTLLSLSQGRLGKAVGLTFQQIQKYEQGTNRISASRLLQLSNALDVPVSFFFDGLGPSGAPRVASPEPGLATCPETQDLVRAYYRIPNPAVRRRLFDLVKAASNDASATSGPSIGASPGLGDPGSP